METEGAMDNQIMSPAMMQQQEQQEELGTIDTQHLQMVEPAVDPSAQVVTQEQQPQAQAVTEPIPPQQEEDPNATLRNETTLIANEEEAFALEPLDITGVKDTRIRRKRKLVVDQIMELDGQTMREQLKDFSDIVSRMDMAPPTKRLMMSKEMGAVEKLFSHPTILLEDFMNKLFQTNLHCSIPEDLLDVSNTQLQQQYGMLEDESKAEESSIQAARADITGDQNAPDLLERSSVAQQKDADSVVPPVDGNQVQPLGYNSDDDYEPYSVGPPSNYSSVGDNMPPPTTTPPRAPEPPSMTDLGNISQDISGLPAPTSEEPQVGGEPFEDLLEPSMTVEEESESYNDDVDDLRWNKRTQHLMHLLHRSYKHQDELSYFQMTEGVGRKQAVSKFYSLLVLAKQEACLLHQSESFSDVFIKKGPRFESVLM